MTKLKEEKHKKSHKKKDSKHAEPSNDTAMNNNQAYEGATLPNIEPLRKAVVQFQRQNSERNYLLEMQAWRDEIRAELGGLG